MQLKQIVSKCRFSENALRPYPTVPFLCFFLSTSIPLGMWEFSYCSKQTAVAVVVFIPLIGLFIFPRPYRVWGLVTASIGLLITWVHIEAPSRSYENMLPRPEVYAEIKAVVTEDRILETESLSELSKEKSIEIRIQGLRLSRYEKWRPCKGRVYYLNPQENIQYGAQLYLKGKFLLPWKNSLPGIFNYHHYLKSKGISHFFKAEEVQIENREPQGWRRGVKRLIRLRENVLHRILRNVGGGSNRKTLAAMTMGFRKSLDPRER